AGGAVGGGNMTLASLTGSTGVVTVSGSGSQLAAGNLRVGATGNGTLTVAAGETVTSVQATIAEQNTSTSSATVTGSGSTWTASNGLYVGGTSTAKGGTGSLTVSSGGAVAGTGETKVRDSGTVTINGDTLTTGAFTRVGTLNLQNGTVTVNGNMASTATPAFTNPTNNNAPTDVTIRGPPPT